MSAKREIIFSLRMTVDGVELTPATIDLAHFNRFNRQVEQFLAGANHQVAAREILVKVETGSYRLVAALSAAAATIVEADLVRLQEQDGLLELDPRRAVPDRSGPDCGRAEPADRKTAQRAPG